MEHGACNTDWAIVADIEKTEYQTGRQRSSTMERYIDWQTDKHMSRQTGRQRSRQTGRQADKHMSRQTGRQTNI